MERDFMQVYLLRVPRQIQRNELSTMLDLVSGEKRERISKFYHAVDAARCLYADLLARYMLVKLTGRTNDELHFLYGEKGKPSLAGSSGIHFNTSHSGDWVAGASGSCELGVDVEKISAIDLDISENYFSPNEYLDIIRSGIPINRFFDFWTLKESYIKFIGQGLSRPLNSFEICFRDNNEIGISSYGTTLDDVFFRQYNVDDEHKMAVCSGHAAFPDSYELTGLDEMLPVLQR